METPIEKYCTICHTTKSISDFGLNNNKSDKLQAYCKSCMLVIRRKHYDNNKQQYKTRNRKTIKRLKDIVINLKTSSSCKNCGIRYQDEPWLMEFDHLEDNKTAEISYLVKRGSENKLLAEIAKCEIVCVLCHRRRTAKRAGWTKEYFV